MIPEIPERSPRDRPRVLTRNSSSGSGREDHLLVVQLALNDRLPERRGHHVSRRLGRPDTEPSAAAAKCARTRSSSLSTTPNDAPERPENTAADRARSACSCACNHPTRRGGGRQFGGTAGHIRGHTKWRRTRAFGAPSRRCAPAGAGLVTTSPTRCQATRCRCATGGLRPNIGRHVVVGGPQEGLASVPSVTCTGLLPSALTIQRVSFEPSGSTPPTSSSPS